MSLLRICLLLNLLLSHLQAVSEFESRILDRNGDVYVLVTKKDHSTPSEVGVYKFSRVVKDSTGKALNDYSDGGIKLGVSNSALQGNMAWYEGLSVDKFGHVKFFRNRGDDSPKNLLNEVPVIHPGATATWPGLVSVSFYDKGGAGNPDTTVNATPPGWVYVVEPSGKYGWYNVHNFTRPGLAGGSGGALGYQYDTGSYSLFDTDTRYLPEVDNGNANINDIYEDRHDGFWRSDCNRGSYAFAPAATGKFHPPINSFWISTENLGGHTRGRRIYSVEKAVTALYLDTYITSEDNALLFGGRTDPRFALTAEIDYFNNGVGELYNEAKSALNTSVAFTQAYKAYNVCGDMCGQDGTDMKSPPIVINKGRATFSSGGNSELNQRSYMVKTYSLDNGAKLVTWVVQLNYNTTKKAYDQDKIVKWDGDFAYGSNDPNGHRGSDDQAGGVGGARIILYNKGSGDFIRTVQTSKRYKSGEVPPDAKDFVYVSNLPPSHFNVSSSFWGTGGIVWWAEEAPGNVVKLHYEQYNHISGKIMKSSATDGPVIANNVEALQAIGADGDNFVYILHGGKGTDGSGGVETAADLTSMLSPLSYERLRALKIAGRIQTDVPAQPFAASICDGGVGPCRIPVTMDLRAGPIIEKIAPLPGSTPVKVGTVPMQNTGATCSTTVLFANNVAPTGTYLSPAAPWNCTAATSGDVLGAYNLEMAVINVANPPATGGDTQLDVVNVFDDDRSYNEDTEYTFQMENPPVFNGPIAQLGLTQDNELTIYNDVPMISNYDVTGINLRKTKLGGLVRNYYDNDGRVGKLRPSFIFQPLSASQQLLHTKLGNVPGAAASKTLRYRWRVLAKTPPHSLKMYPGMASCEPLLNKPRLSAENIDLLKAYNYLDPTGAELGLTPVAGVAYDSCWKDLPEIDGEKNTYPESLKYSFNDPGLYDVVLMFGGLRFNADSLTFLDNPDSVKAEISVTFYAMPVTVGAKVPGAGDEIKDAVIANNDLTDTVFTRSGVYSDLAQMKANLTTDGSMTGSQGRFPVLPIANYGKSSGPSSKPLVVTYEKQRTPIVAEAEIQLFRMRDLIYSDLSNKIGSSYKGQEKGWQGTTDTLQTKMRGVGTWDYNYPGRGSLNVNGFKFEPVDKTKTHPANFSASRANKIQAEILTTEKRHGYDASGDPQSGMGYSEVLARHFDPDMGNSVNGFYNAHQGSLASCHYYPALGGFAADADTCMVTHPESFYSWWEIKYAWFMRYKKPDGTKVKKIIKTGNLGEIFSLNLMARHNPEWKRLVYNLAPEHLRAANYPANLNPNTALADYPLMQYVGYAKDARLRVRIPLINPGALLEGSDLNEMNSALKDWGSESFDSLYSKIHPMAIQIPTEPTVVEIGCQIFYPIMNWEGRDKKAGTTPVEYAYYDAVYWGDLSEAANTATIADWTDRPDYNFGDKINTWKRFATVRNVATLASGIDADALKIGLKLSATEGGMGTDGSSDTATYTAPGNAVDDFTEILVLDQTAPKLSVIQGASIEATTGGRASEDVVLETSDNNPYGQWKSWQEVGAVDKMENTPALVHFAYEFGYDPRNLFGLGMKSKTAPERAYGFNLSQVSVNAGDALDNNNQKTLVTNLPQYDLLREFSGQPFTVSNPGYTYGAAKLQDALSDFYYPFKNDGYPTDGLMVERKNDQNFPSGNSIVAHFDAQKDTWTRRNLNTLMYYMPDQYLSSIKDPGLRQVDPTLKTEGNNRLISFTPPHNVAPFRMAPDYAGDSRMQYVEPDGSGIRNYKRQMPACLSTLPPHLENTELCRIYTRWRVPKETIVAPYYLNGDYAGTYHMYAKARDVRFSESSSALHGSGIWSSVPADYFRGNFGSWPAYVSDGFLRRMGEENYSLDHFVPATPSADVEAHIEKMMNHELQRRATRIGNLSVADNDAPNFRVILSESKYRSQVEYTVMGAQGNLIKEGDPASQADSDRLLFFKTQDMRGTGDLLVAKSENSVFTAGAKTNYTKKDADAQDLRVNEMVGSTLPQDMLYRIPEDVRFEVRVQAGDNRELDNIGIRITGGNADKFTSTLPHVSTKDPNYIFPLTETTSGRIYQQTKFASAFHLYPKAGFYDVLKIEVFDKANYTGNGRVIYIPIEIINQNVYFRKIGDDAKVN